MAQGAAIIHVEMMGLVTCGQQWLFLSAACVEAGIVRRRGGRV